MNLVYIFIISFLFIIENYFLISLLQHSYYDIKRVGYRFIDQIKIYPLLFILTIFINVILIVVCYFYPNYLLLTLLSPICSMFFTPKLKLKFTPRGIRLFITTYLIELSLILTLYFKCTSYLLFSSCSIIIIPVSLILSLIILSVYEIPKKNYCFKEAKRKLEENENLLIIGITGSYGKTTIKNFIRQLLTPKEILVSTGNINTPLGLANFIRKNVTIFDKILILELGVDSKNGMQKFKKFIKLDYALICGLTNQHLRTFKNFENIKKEKEAISELLKPQGMLIYNADDINIIKTRKDIFYTPCSKKDYIILGREKNFTLINYNSLILKIPFTIDSLIYDGFISYVLVNKISSSSLIRFNLSSLSLPSRRKKITKIGELVVIDDSYNLNLLGLKDSLNKMKSYEEPYYILTGGMKETGGNIAMLYTYFSLINIVDKIYYIGHLMPLEKRIIGGIPCLKQKICFVKKFKYPKKGCLLLLTMGDKSSLF